MCKGEIEVDHNSAPNAASLGFGQQQPRETPVYVMER